MLFQPQCYWVNPRVDWWWKPPWTENLHPAVRSTGVLAPKQALISTLLSIIIIICIYIYVCIGRTIFSKSGGDLKSDIYLLCINSHEYPCCHDDAVSCHDLPTTVCICTKQPQGDALPRGGGTRRRFQDPLPCVLDWCWSGEHVQSGFTVRSVLMAHFESWIKFNVKKSCFLCIFFFFIVGFGFFFNPLMTYFRFVFKRFECIVK